VPILWDAVVRFSFTAVSTANGNFLVVPVLHSVGDMTYETNAAALSCKRTLQATHRASYKSTTCTNFDTTNVKQNKLPTFFSALG
jgi:hypothetical protein